MAASIPTTEPTTIQAGDTVKWTKSFADYSAADSWILTYEINGTQKLTTVTATTTNTTDYAVTITAAQSAIWDAGTGTNETYWWDAFVTSTPVATEERYNIGSGTFLVLVDKQVVAGAYDGRSDAKKTLDTINEGIRLKISDGVQTMQVEGEMLIRYSMDQLLKLKDRYQVIYDKEQAALDLAKGIKSKNKVYTRFV